MNAFGSIWKRLARAKAILGLIALSPLRTLDTTNLSPISGRSEPVSSSVSIKSLISCTGVMVALIAALNALSCSPFCS
ncbi:hypothetical protein D3C71_1868410 [compost metagenome]